MKQVLLIVLLAGISSWGMAQCNSIHVTNYTTATLDVGGQALIPVSCPPGGAPEVDNIWGLTPGSFGWLNASPGKEFRIVGATSGLLSGSNTSPAWVGSACAPGPSGDYTIIFYPGPGGVCKIEIF
ncbi:MAG: hypothetical protein ACFB10_06895 [Salibacteraceae bacterium]